MEISIVIPTRNEQENITEIINQVSIYGKIIVVDDSDDVTPRIARALGATVIIGKRKGLGQAIIDGISVADTPIVVVMDADLSHNPKDILRLVNPLMNGYDMTIGSRYVKGGGTEGWEISRRIISRVACLLALPITTVKDTTSGFFAIRKDIVDGVPLEGKSWKTMLEILVKAKPMRVKEIPIIFKVREQGKSKFNKKQVVAYLKHIWSLALFKYSRFLKFCVVGGTGAIITFFLTWLLTEQFGFWYMASLVIAVAIATVSNFIFNSLWTFAIGKDMTDPDYEWNAYYRGNAVQRWWKHEITKKVVDMLPENRTDLRVLDIGCGSSPIANEIGSINYLGVDNNRKKIQFMRNRLPYYKYETDFNQSQISDVVLALEVVEHLPSWQGVSEFLLMVADHTRTGGTVIIATPDYSKWQWKTIEKIYGWLMPSAYANDHKIRFDEPKLIEVCKDYGLVHVKTELVLGCDMICKFRKYS